MRFLSFVFILFLGGIIPLVFADDFVPEGENDLEVSADTFILDADNTGGDIKLQFGKTLGKFLTWDAANGRFKLSDTLRAAGNLEQDGNVLTLDADNSGAGADVDIVANQGADNAGTIRYSAANNRWEISNDGASFVGIAAGGTMLVFNQTLVNNGTATFSHASDVDNKRIVQVKEEVTATGATDSSLDFDAVDEATYIQENAANTQFVGGVAKLEGVFSGAVGGTNLTSGKTVSASTSSQPAINGNDTNNNTFWYTTSGGSNGGWWQVDLGGGAPAVRRATVRWYTTTSSYRCSTFNIEGSNTDGSGYVSVYTGNTSADPQEATYNFAPNTYRYWRFVCTTATNTNYYVVREFRLFEALASYPLTPYYVTTDANTITTSSWTGVTNFDFTQTTPALTSIRYLVSFDGKTTWKYWNGTAWTASSLANLQTDGMTEASIEAITSAQWMAAGGINSDAAETLDIAFDLDTNDSAVTPSVDQLDITFTTPNYWKINTQNYDIHEYSTTETQVTNKTGATKNVKITILVP